SKSALGAFFRRIKSRHGTPAAITAAAHKLARLGYSLLKHGTDYVAQEMEAYEAKYRERKLQTLARQAGALGVQLVPAAGAASARAARRDGPGSRQTPADSAERDQTTAVPQPPWGGGKCAPRAPHPPLDAFEMTVVAGGSSLGGPACKQSPHRSKH